MRFLIVRTDIRSAAPDDVAAAWAADSRLRDEQVAPEARRQIIHADDRDAALVLARALSATGAVRAGRQRVKVVPLPLDHCCRPDWSPAVHHRQPSRSRDLPTAPTSA